MCWGLTDMNRIKSDIAVSSFLLWTFFFRCHFADVAKTDLVPKNDTPFGIFDFTT